MFKNYLKCSNNRNYTCEILKGRIFVNHSISAFRSIYQKLKIVIKNLNDYDAPKAFSLFLF